MLRLAHTILLVVTMMSSQMAWAEYTVQINDDAEQHSLHNAALDDDQTESTCDHSCHGGVHNLGIISENEILPDKKQYLQHISISLFVDSLKQHPPTPPPIKS